MLARNRNVDLAVLLGTLGRMIGHRTADGNGTNDIIAPPPILQFDADRSAVTAATAANEDGQFRSITLREYSTEELVTIHQGKHNLLSIAPIIEKTGTDTSRFGVSGSARRGDALYTAEHATIRRAIVEAIRPLRERYNVAMRALNNDVVNTTDRTVDIWLAGNLAGGFANGTFVPTGIDIQEAAARHGLDRVRIHPYLILPSTGNGADFPTSATSAIYSFRQVMAGCLRPEIIRDEKLSGTRRPAIRVFEGPTIVCPHNGRVTFANRETTAALTALDINLRGDARFSTDSYFTDFTGHAHAGQIGRDMICRAVGHTVVQFDPRRAADGLGARLSRRIGERLHAGTHAGSPATMMPVNRLSEITALLESAERPTGTDIGTEAYSTVANARFDFIQPAVQDAHDQLQQRVTDYEARIITLADQFVQDYGETLEKQVQQAIGSMGLDGTGKLLVTAKEHHQKVAADFLERYVTPASPDAAPYQALMAQLQGLAEKASRKWFTTRRETKQMRQIAVEATNLDLAAFDVRIGSVRLMAGRAVINKLVHLIERLLNAIAVAGFKVQELISDADKRLSALANSSVPVELPGIIMPTPADIEAMVQELFGPRIGDLASRVIPTCTSDAAGTAVTIQTIVQRETANLKLDDVTVVNFVERWPNAIDLDKFAEERINESWPTAPLDPTVEPGYAPPILRVLRSCGGSQNAGPFMDKLRNVQVEAVSQVRDQDFGDPRRIIISHEQRFIAARQIAYLHVLEKEAESIAMELEPFLTTCVSDPRLLDEFRCGAMRDENSAWGTFVRSVARKTVTRHGDNTYVLGDVALHGPLHVAADDGRVAQGLPAIIGRLTNDATLRKGLDEIFIAGLQRDGRTAIVKQYLAAMYCATDYVPAGSVSKFMESLSREIFKLMPECRTTEDAARLSGYTPPTGEPAKPIKPKRDRKKDENNASPEQKAAEQPGHVGDGKSRARGGPANDNGTGHQNNSELPAPAVPKR